MKIKPTFSTNFIQIKGIKNIYLVITTRISFAISGRVNRAIIVRTEMNRVRRVTVKLVYHISFHVVLLAARVLYS